MQTIQINNAELENFINTQYGEDKSTLVKDFMVFLKEKADFLRDKREFNKTFEKVQKGTEALLTQEQYDKRIKDFKNKLEDN